MYEARIQDVPAMVARARDSHDRSVHAHIAFDVRDTEATFSDLIRDDAGLVLTDGRGGFYAGLLTPFHFNRSRFRLLEIGFDGLPLRALLPELTDRVPDGTEIAFAAERGPRSKALGRLYRACGLSPSALSYTTEVHHGN